VKSTKAEEEWSSVGKRGNEFCAWKVGAIAGRMSSSVLKVGNANQCAGAAEAAAGVTGKGSELSTSEAA